MRLYLDTEFNGFGGELISLALVAEPSPLVDVGYLPESFYGARQFSAPVHPWVAEHVIPKLFTSLIEPDVFRAELHEFLLNFKNPEIICDWHADAEHFCKMLAGDDYGGSLDFACSITILKTPPGQPVSKNPHNARADARALMEWHQGVLEQAV